MTLSRRYDDALLFAHQQHRKHTRKKTSIPYIAHPLAVSSLVLEFGGGEDEAIAALLHDTLEDVGRHLEPDIEYLFGPRVLDIVRECSDEIADGGEKQDSWVIRKQRYLAEIPGKSPGAQLVTACDKLHNLTTIVRGYHAIGDEIWTRFSGKKIGTRWYYENLGDRFIDLGLRPAPSLELKLREIDWSPRRYQAPDLGDPGGQRSGVKDPG
jgi:(p)ppGpp synthase/HD superfamily hydrolase